MNKDIMNKNNKGQFHGYQERYWCNSKLYFKVFYHNDAPIGYCEFYYRYNWDGRLEKMFFI